MAQSTAGGPLASTYERRIGDASNANEVMGYWVFSAGVILGFLGLVLYYLTAAATMSRAVGYALAALAPALLMAGAVLRFPLRKMATTLVGVGLALTFAAIAWFLIVFPGGWSLSSGNSTVIVTYIAGLAVLGVAGSIVPLATNRHEAALSAAEHRADAAETARAAASDRHDDALDAAEDRADTAETAGANAAAASRESERAGAVREEHLADEIVALTAEIEGLEGDNDDLLSSKAEFELYTGTDDKWRWRLVHDNGNIIADSGESYSSKAMAAKGLGSVKLNALGAAINEL